MFNLQMESAIRPHHVAHRQPVFARGGAERSGDLSKVVFHAEHCGRNKSWFSTDHVVGGNKAGGTGDSQFQPSVMVCGIF